MQLLSDDFFLYPHISRDIQRGNSLDLYNLAVRQHIFTVSHPRDDRTFRLSIST